MSDPISYGIPPVLIKRGLALAERRRDYYADIYRSGRWRRYFSERELVKHTREAVELVETWTNFSAARDSVVGGAPSAQPRPPACFPRAFETAE
jgi:uncharacterized repeat protein (TIGR03809 family)